MNESSVGLMMGVGMGVIIVCWILALGLCGLMIISQWQVFKKAGKHGWAAIVPFYNSYVLTEIAWGNGWLMFLMFLPLGNIVFSILTCIKLAKAFGKSGGFAVGLIFLPVVFYPMLAFGVAEYEGTDDTMKKGTIIATVVTGIVGVLLYILIFVSYYSFFTFDMAEETGGLVNDIPSIEEMESYGEDLDGHGEDVESAEESIPIEGYDDFELIEVSNGIIDIQKPILKGADTYGSLSTGYTDGVTVQVNLSYGEESNALDALALAMESTESFYSGVPEFYSGLKTGEVTGDETAAYQAFDYTVSLGDESYPCRDIVKSEIVDGYSVVTHIMLDGTSATENTERLFQEACELYEIGSEL